MGLAAGKPGGFLFLAAYALELCGNVRLQWLSDGGHVVGPAEISADQAVQPPARGYLLGRGSPDHCIGGHLDLRPGLLAMCCS